MALNQWKHKYSNIIYLENHIEPANSTKKLAIRSVFWSSLALKTDEEKN